jgi:hypothetical protein
MNTFANMNGDDADAPLQDGVVAWQPVPTPSVLPMVGRLPGASSAAGVALTFATDDAETCGEDRFALLLVDPSGQTLMRLGPFGEDDVVAVWRDCAAKSGLPRMIVRETGALAIVTPQLGPVALGTTRTRRKHGLLNGRRPRFLVRRKTGRLPARPQIFRGEHEIVSGALS